MVEFRSAALEDFKGLAQFKRDIHVMHLEHVRDVFRDVQEPLALEELQGIIAGKDGRGAYVLLDNGRLAGYAFTKVIESRSHPLIIDQKVLFIEDMYIGRELRRKGYGRQLMNGLKQIATNSECGSILLDVWEWNKGAIAFYEALGLQSTTIRMKLRVQPQR